MTEPNLRHITRSSSLPCAEASGAAIPRVCAVTAFKRELRKSFSVLHCGSGAGIGRELPDGSAERNLNPSNTDTLTADDPKLPVANGGFWAIQNEPSPYSSLYREQLYTKRSNTDLNAAIFHRCAIRVRQQIPQSAAILRDAQNIPRKPSSYLTWGEIHNQQRLTRAIRAPQDKQSWLICRDNLLIALAKILA